MLAFDPETLHRLGYGGGYYDRTLNNMSTMSNHTFFTIGMAFEVQKILAKNHDEIDCIIDQYDHKLDCIVTEEG